MEYITSIVLGLIQGITEFLPISSSGHLVIAGKVFGLSSSQSIPFNVFLNTATLIAVVYCFWGDIKKIIPNKLLMPLIIGTIPAGFIGFFWKNSIEQTFYSSSSVAWALILGSLLMFFADKANKKLNNQNTPITNKKSLAIGFFQSLALIPGFSRSGSSISGGLFMRLSREEAIRFSFLLYIPVSLGALIKIIMDTTTSEIILEFGNIFALISFFISLASGIWAIRFMLRYLSKNSFKSFIIYRLLLAFLIFIFL